MTGGGPSIDQHIAGQLDAAGVRTKLRSLELRVHPTAAGNLAYSYMCYAGKAQPVASVNDPVQIFGRLFADPPASPDDPAARLAQMQKLARRTSVLDHVLGEYKSLAARVGTDDRQRLEQHFTAVRNVEMRLATQAGMSAPQAAACKKAASPTATTDIPKLGRTLMDLLKIAWECDLTRVATIQWGQAATNLTLRWLGMTKDWHTVSHNPGEMDPTAVKQLVDIDTWLAGELAYFLGELRKTPDAEGGNLLTSSSVLWVNEIARGYDHSQVAVPFLVAGRLGGALRTGRRLKFSGRAHNDLLVTVMNAMGIPGAQFGDPRHNQGPLPGLLA